MGRTTLVALLLSTVFVVVIIAVAAAGGGSSTDRVAKCERAVLVQPLDMPAARIPACAGLSKTQLDQATRELAVFVIRVQEAH